MDAVLFISWTVAVVTVTLLWVHVSAQTKVARTATNSLRIAIRLIAVQCILAYSLHHICTISMMVTLIIMAVILIIAAVVSLDSAPGDAILMTIVLPHYVLQQFILGFPDRHLVIPNPERAPANCEPPARKADTGIAFTALRPMGTIEIAGERFSAASEAGTMILAGTPVRVVACRGTLYLVAPIDADAP